MASSSPLRSPSVDPDALSDADFERLKAYAVQYYATDASIYTEDAGLAILGEEPPPADDGLPSFEESVAAWRSISLPEEKIEMQRDVAELLRAVLAGHKAKRLSEAAMDVIIDAPAPFALMNVRFEDPFLAGSSRPSSAAEDDVPRSLAEVADSGKLLFAIPPDFSHELASLPSTDQMLALTPSCPADSVALLRSAMTLFPQRPSKIPKPKEPDSWLGFVDEDADEDAWTKMRERAAPFLSPPLLPISPASSPAVHELDLRNAQNEKLDMADVGDLLGSVAPELPRTVMDQEVTQKTLDEFDRLPQLPSSFPASPASRSPDSRPAPSSTLPSSPPFVRTEDLKMDEGVLPRSLDLQASAKTSDTLAPTSLHHALALLEPSSHEVPPQPLAPSELTATAAESEPEPHHDATDFLSLAGLQLDGDGELGASEAFILRERLVVEEGLELELPPDLPTLPFTSPNDPPLVPLKLADIAPLRKPKKGKISTASLGPPREADVRVRLDVSKNFKTLKRELVWRPFDYTSGSRPRVEDVARIEDWQNEADAEQLLSSASTALEPFDPILAVEETLPNALPVRPSPMEDVLLTRSELAAAASDVGSSVSASRKRTHSSDVELSPAPAPPKAPRLAQPASPSPSPLRAPEQPLAEEDGDGDELSYVEFYRPSSPAAPPALHAVAAVPVIENTPIPSAVGDNLHQAGVSIALGNWLRNRKLEALASSQATSPAPQIVAPAIASFSPPVDAPQPQLPLHSPPPPPSTTHVYFASTGFLSNILVYRALTSQQSIELVERESLSNVDIVLDPDAAVLLHRIAGLPTSGPALAEKLVRIRQAQQYDEITLVLEAYASNYKPGKLAPYQLTPPNLRAIDALKAQIEHSGVGGIVVVIAETPEETARAVREVGERRATAQPTWWADDRSWLLDMEETEDEVDLAQSINPFAAAAMTALKPLTDILDMTPDERVQTFALVVGLARIDRFNRLLAERELDMASSEVADPEPSPSLAPEIEMVGGEGGDGRSPSASWRPRSQEALVGWDDAAAVERLQAEMWNASL